MNPILEKVLENRNGHYVHALEVDSIAELESCIDALVDELVREEYDKADIRDFVESLSIYYLSEVENEEDEEEVYNYDVSDRLSYLLD